MLAKVARQQQQCSSLLRTASLRTTTRMGSVRQTMSWSPVNMTTIPAFVPTTGWRSVGTIRKRYVTPLPFTRKVRFGTTTTTKSGSTNHAAKETSEQASRREMMVEKSKPHMSRLKEMWRKYGLVAIGTYVTMYGIVLGSIYLAMDLGLVQKAKPVLKRFNTQGHVVEDKDREANEDDFSVVSYTNKWIEIAEKYGIADYMDVHKVNSKTGTFLLAWVATKFTEPLRLALTVAITPRVARLVGRVPKH